MEAFTRTQIVEMLADKSDIEKIDRWLARGDACAVYRNEDLGHPGLGNLKFVSFGSSAAQLEGTPPNRLPDIGDIINWRYVLIGACYGS